MSVRLDSAAMPVSEETTLQLSLDRLTASF